MAFKSLLALSRNCHHQSRHLYSSASQSQTVSVAQASQFTWSEQLLHCSAPAPGQSGHEGANIQLGDIVRQLKLYWGFNNEGDIFSPPSKALPLSLTTETAIYLIAFSCVCAAQCTLNSKYCRKEVEA